MSGGGSLSSATQTTQSAPNPFAAAAAQTAQPQMNWQTGQPVQQATQPAYQPQMNTGWNRPQFNTDPTQMSPTQNWWLNNPMGAAATANVNAQNVAALPEDQRAGYKPLDAQEALNQTLRNQIKAGMGNYGNMVNYANKTGISTQDIQQAIGGGNDVYTYMNRPNYQQYSPNGQFNQPIYQSNYQNYNTGNAMGVSQYGQGQNPYAAGMTLASTPFNPYTNSFQTTPFSTPQSQQYYPQVPLANYGPSQPVVSRSAGMRGTPNVVRRAEGGIASLMDSVE